MQNLLALGMVVLADTMADHASDAIVYSRGASSITVNATQGSTQFEEVDDDGVQVSFHSKDFVVRTIDFAAMGEPEPYDRVTKGDKTYEVLSRSDAPCFRYTDPFRTMLRIHTKEVVT